MFASVVVNELFSASFIYVVHRGTSCVIIFGALLPTTYVLCYECFQNYIYVNITNVVRVLDCLCLSQSNSQKTKMAHNVSPPKNLTTFKQDHRKIKRHM